MTLFNTLFDMGSNAGTWISAAGDALGIVSTLAGTAMANKSNQKIARQTNEANKELAEYQAQWNERMWNLQNEYNSPSAQMERYRAAGLNPNLIYGQGSPGNANSAPSYDRPTMQGYTYDSPLAAVGSTVSGAVNRFLGVRQLALQNQRLEKELDMMDYQRDILSYKVIGESLANDLKSADYRRKNIYNSFYNDLLTSQVSAAKASLENIMRKGDLMDQEFKFNIERNEREWQRLGFDRSRLSLDYRRLALSWNKLGLDERKTAMMEQLNSLRSRLTATDIRRMESLIDRLGIENDILDVHRRFEQILGSKNANLFMNGLKMLIQIGTVL